MYYYIALVTKKLFVLFLAIIVFSFAIRFWRFDEPKDYYFDEVYHAVTAKAYADNNPEPYDPFSKAPQEGTAYDWLHPPLAKLVQAGSIKIFGDNSFGWRLPSVIFGSAVVGATFALAFVLFGPTVAIFSSLVIAFENLTFVMSRITMNDVFVTTFILLSFTFAHLFVKTDKFKYLLVTSLFLGLAVSSKWTGAYAIGAVGIYMLLAHFRSVAGSTKAHFGSVTGVLKLSLLIIIPVIVYLLSYSQFWLQGHNVQQFIDLHKQIWWYQNRRDLEHSYGSTPLYCATKGLDGPKTWCPWILDARGVYFSYEEYGDKAGYIYALGNPLIFWTGVLAVSYLLGKYLENRKREYFLILIGYFIFWVPWIFSPRIMFLYHYLPSVPFLSISLGIIMAGIYQTRFKIAAIILLVTFAVAFFYFYPINSGLPIDPQSIDKYMWLKTWR